MAREQQLFQDALVDIRDVKLDDRLSQSERVKSFVQQIKDPYCFKVGEVIVRVAYAENGTTLNDCFADMLSLL